MICPSCGTVTEVTIQTKGRRGRPPSDKTKAAQIANTAMAQAGKLKKEKEEAGLISAFASSTHSSETNLDPIIDPIVALEDIDLDLDIDLEKDFNVFDAEDNEKNKGNKE
jgi:uncharacterized Zn finger protein (UPF0148 family)